ncbi:MAG: oligosaccharide flippase family protein, partial [Chthoniobacter sp.]
MSAVVERVINGVCALAQIPLALQILGQEAFGLWMTLTSLVTILTVADFGLGIGVQNAVSRACGQDDLPSAIRAASTGILMLAGIGLTLFLLCTPICLLIDWGAVFHVKDPILYPLVGKSLLAIVAFFSLGLPLTAANRISNAFQMSWMNNIRGILTSIVTVALIFISARLKIGFLPFLIVAIAPQAIGSLVQLIVFYRRLGWSFNFLVSFDRAFAPQLFRSNWLFVLPNIGATIMGLAPAFFISAELGASALTSYSLIQKLLSLTTQAQSMLLAPMWPAYTEAAARGDIGWTHATYRRSLLASLVCAVVPPLSFPLWGRWVLHLWTHQPADSFDLTLVVVVSLWVAVSNFSQPPGVLLNALGKFRGQASYGLISV